MPLYDTLGLGYASLRRPEPRIASIIHSALTGIRTVANIGAGAGSYEPTDRDVIAIEPSDVMIRQRPPGAAPCLQASAESLPLDTNAVDAAMAVLTMHHWSDLEQGLSEMARVARRRIVLFTWVPDAPPFWLTHDYLPEILAHDRTIFPSTLALSALLERIIAPAHITPVPIPHDCADGFLCAYWRRPEAYLDPRVRAAISSFARIDTTHALARLRADLETGRWAEQHHHLLDLDALDLGYRLITCELSH